MPFLWLKYRRPAALALSAACKETQCLPSSKGPPSHPGSSSRCQPLPQPPQHPLHALLPPHQPPSPAAHDPPSAPTRFRRTAHAVSAPPPPRPDPPPPRPRFKIKGPPALAPPPSSSTYCILAPTKLAAFLHHHQFLPHRHVGCRPFRAPPHRDPSPCVHCRSYQFSSVLPLSRYSPFSCASCRAAKLPACHARPALRLVL